jgi:trehalose synthase
MWKGACVVGGNVGGIRHQITDGKDGFLVDDTVQAAERIIQLLTNEGLRRRLSLRARKTVADRFLMSRLAEDWIDLIGSLVSDNTRGGADRCVSLS